MGSPKLLGRPRMSMVQLDISLKLRFWRKVDKNGSKYKKLGRCWNWTGGKIPSGYGRTFFKRRCEYAHRVSWYLHYRVMPTCCVLHHCDNPACVNPNHLFLGTMKDNMLDRDSKGRTHHPPSEIWQGEKSPAAKLTTELVLLIRKIPKYVSHASIARELSVSGGAISLIRRRMTWTHISVVAELKTDEPLFGRYAVAIDCILTRVQAEISDWAQEQFGDNPSHHPLYEGAKLFSIPPFLGMVEEMGEIAAPQAKRHQGRKFKDGKGYKEAIEDGLADLLIFACDFSRREGIQLAETLDHVWQTVKARRQVSWEADKAKETTLGNGGVFLDGKPVAFVSNQGFAEPPDDITLAQVSNLDLVPPTMKITEEDIALTSSFGDGVPSVGSHKKLNHSYNRFCGSCNKVPIHQHNSSGVCADCMADIKAGRRLPVSQSK